MVLLLLAAGCTPQPIQIVDDGLGAGDLDAPTDSGDGDSGPVDDSGGDTEDTGDTGATGAPAFDLSRWSGIRHFQADANWWSCDQVVAEAGEQAEWGEGDEEVRAALEAACPDCERFYLVTPEADVICDYVQIGPTWRGLRIAEDGTASLVVLVYVDGAEGVYPLGEDDQAAFHAGVLSYRYTFDFYSADVEIYGVASFPVK